MNSEEMLQSEALMWPNRKRETEVPLPASAGLLDELVNLT